MKKTLVLGSMVSALVLMGAGCTASNTAPTTQTQEQNTMPAEQSQTPASSLPQSQNNTPASSQPAPAAQTTNPSTPAPTPAASTQPETKEVTIASFAFAPASITVKAGTTIKWTNKDSAPHSIVSSDGQFAASSVLSNGGTYQLKFDKPGTYTYACGLHPSMSGTIIVQ